MSNEIGTYTWHAGVEVTVGTKYVLRSDILYGAPLNGG